MATLSRVTTAWEPGAVGVPQLPSGRIVRGRALRRPVPAGPLPQFALYLLARQPPPVPWDACREAVAYVRRHYDPRSVETPWQRRFVGFR